MQSAELGKVKFPLTLPSPRGRGRASIAQRLFELLDVLRIRREQGVVRKGSKATGQETNQVAVLNGIVDFGQGWVVLRAFIDDEGDKEREGGEGSGFSIFVLNSP